MPKPSYPEKSIEQAHRWIAKAFDASGRVNDFETT